MAAEIGFSQATRGAMRLSRSNTASMASGMPCPAMARLPKRSIRPMTAAPATGISSVHQRPAMAASWGSTKCRERRPNHSKLRKRAINRERIHPPIRPTTPIRLPSTTMRPNRYSDDTLTFTLLIAPTPWVA